MIPTYFSRLSTKFLIILSIFCLYPAAPRAEGGLTKAIQISSQSLIERDTRILATTAAKRLDAILDPLFADFHSRVTLFGEWAFGWRTGYRLLRQGMLTAITLPFSESSELSKVNTVWDELIASKFNELVLEPSGGVAELRSMHDRWRANLRPIVEYVLADTVRTVALLHGQAMPLLQDDADEGFTAEDEFPFVSEVTAAASPIKMRAARPLLSRITLRPPVAAAVTAAGEAIGNQTETLLGSVSNLAAVIVAFLSIDYMLSQTDAGIHRPNLELEVHRVLENEHKRLRKVWLAEQQAEVEARLTQIRPFLQH